MAKSGVEHLAKHPGWKTKRRNSKPIILFMEGGLIQSVSGIPEGLTIVVRDYDTCDTSNPRVHKDADGDLYFENSWDASDNLTEKQAKPVR